MDTECVFCANNSRIGTDLPSREQVYVNEYWRVIVNSSALPGWLLVICRRHVESLAELTPEESASLGPILSGGTAALDEVVQSIKSYVLLFAEATKHLHLSLVPRMPDLPDHLKGAAISAYNTEGDALTESERDDLATQLSAAWVPAH